MNPSILDIVRSAGLALLLSLLSGCDTSTDGTGTDPIPVSPPVSEITITGNDRMRFEPATFTVRAESQVTLTFQNIGTLPKATMGHNLVILLPGTNTLTFATAATNFLEHDYIAPQYADRVVATTRILGPGESQILQFRAPSTPGRYPVVCSFPGHTQAGMVGTMTVVR